MNFSNHKFYKGELKADDSVKNTLLSYNEEETFLHTPVDFIDTSGCSFDDIMNPESLSHSNPDEATLLIKHLKLLLSEYQNSSQDILTVGIISPYKEQVQYLTQLVEADDDFQTFPIKLAIKTIDGFQGQERDIIYISLVRSNDSAEIGFLSDIRRMNVALTRAKKKLVVIGNSATLANHPFYKDFIEYCEKIGAYKSAWEFTE
jgi:ATP-dependent RNA/DNA helicase IGHMBP2